MSDLQIRKATRQPVIPESVLGRKFGRLTAGTIVRRPKIWCVECKCDCGKETVVTYYNLTHGKSQSCGCLNREALLVATTKHGGCRRTVEHDAEYNIWSVMVARCENEKRPDFMTYGGRGIKVCERWRNSYAAFREDVGLRPSMAHTLDRFPNQNGNYEPGNVRWATSVQQNNNRRNNRILEFNGKRQTLADWGRELGVNPLTLRQRLVYGWSVAETLTTPVRPVTR